MKSILKQAYQEILHGSASFNLHNVLRRVISKYQFSSDLTFVVPNASHELFVCMVLELVVEASMQLPY